MKMNANQKRVQTLPQGRQPQILLKIVGCAKEISQTSQVPTVAICSAGNVLWSGVKLRSAI